MHRLFALASSILALTLAAAAQQPANPKTEDPWTKVIALETGADLRVHKKGGGPPTLLQMDHAGSDTLYAIARNAQISIAKSDIDRIDARPPSGPRVVKENKNKVDDPAAKAPPPATPHGANVPGITSSTGFIVGSKPPFEIVYRRPR